MAVPRKIPWDRDPHTEVKHRILESYLVQWFPKLMQATHTEGVTYLEGFSGPGVYSNGEPGSPVIALRTFLRHGDLMTGAKHVNLLLNDANPACIERLRQEIGAAASVWTPPGIPPGMTVRYSEKPCGPELIDDATALGARGTAIFAFLDSFGGPDIPFKVLQQVARLPSGEVFLTFGPRYLVQFGKPDETTKGDDVFGDSHWQQVYTSMSSDKKRVLVDSYHKTLRSAGFRHTLQFELVDEGGRPLFLLFGTRHPKGVEVMKDAFWVADPVTGISYRDPRDPHQEMIDWKLGPDLNPLARILYRKLRGGPYSVGVLRTYAGQQTIYRESHVPDALNILRRQGLVYSESRRKRLTKNDVVQIAGDHRSAI